MGGIPCLEARPSGVNFTEFLAAYPDFRNAQLIRRLAGGGGWNQSWLVARGLQRLVIRLDTSAVPRLGLDRAAEAAVLRAIHGQKIGPEVVLADAKEGVLVTRWLAGRACTPVLLRNPYLLRALGLLLGRLHKRVAPPPGQPELDMGLAMARYAETVGGAFARRLARAGTRAWHASRPGERRVVLCHNDPVAQNLLQGPTLRLIDWEFAAPGDPLFDLAVVIGHHGLNERQADIVLAAARGGVRAADRRALERLVEAYGCLRELWDCAVRRLLQRRSPASGPAGV